MKNLIFVLLISVPFFCVAQVERVEPTNWYVGMKNPDVQLLWYGKNVSAAQISLKYPGVTIKKIHKVENPNYLFVDLTISKNAKPGTVSFDVQLPGAPLPMKYAYELRQKTHKPLLVSPADFVYLIMPDRFANGDTTNDKFADMRDPQSDRSNPFLRHGGDFQGIINHLDYLQELGVTSLWLTPVLENNGSLKKELHGNMQASYHGYHFTDHYQIDRRLGGNEGYKKLGNALHQRGLKLIQDAVYNHVSEDHWMYRDQPTKDWFNNWPAYTETTHKEMPLSDPHGANIDRKVLSDGWFTKFLPDLNQRNPFLARYLTQHAVWSTENFNLDGWRIDTYKYNDLPFMNQCNQALMDEYPNLLIFGETVANTPAALSYYVKNNVDFKFKCNQPSTCDFPAFEAVKAGLNEPFSWDGGMSRLYNTLAQDFLYAAPDKLVTFLENHDTDRFFSVVGQDLDKYKMGIAWLLTTRGVPHFYYGTEVLMKNFKNPTDAEVRRDFTGGWADDKENKFSSQGRNAQENEAFGFVKKLANYRKNTPALHGGEFTQYVPKNGIYVYFRHNATKTIMVVLNTNATETKLNTTRFGENIKTAKTAKNILTDQTVTDLQTLVLPAKATLILELQ